MKREFKTESKHELFMAMDNKGHRYFGWFSRCPTRKSKEDAGKTFVKPAKSSFLYKWFDKEFKGTWIANRWIRFMDAEEFYVDRDGDGLLSVSDPWTSEESERFREGLKKLFPLHFKWVVVWVLREFNVVKIEVPEASVSKMRGKMWCSAHEEFVWPTFSEARDYLVLDIDDKIRELQRVMDKLTRMKGPRK